MTVPFETYQYSYRRKGKPVFVPSEPGERIGRALKSAVERAVTFDSFYYHLRAGGHVAALHAHRDHSYFARLDIERYFYSIARNRVARALHEAGVARAKTRAKWSCVRNPYGEPRYVLPYGFVQSPILATLVLMRSPVGTTLRALPEGVTPSVYMDDIALSSDDETLLASAYADVRRALADGNFAINETKARAPAEAIELFNCNLSQGFASVLEVRRDEFFAVERTPASLDAFARYCGSVEKGNHSAPST